jgi:glycosyltransferase involved in cell wall biosynthesis
MADSWRNEVNKDAMGGTELMMTGLYDRLGEEFLEDFQIIPSRVREIDASKVRVYWAHDLVQDPEAKNALDNKGWSRFHKIVFVSHWQQQQYISEYGIPWDKTVVMKNAIEPINVDMDQKFENKNPIKIVYHTTPHRGLKILIPVFDKLLEVHDDIELDVYSSFGIYGWEDRNEVPEIKEILDKAREHPKINYHGHVTNQEIKEELKNQHIFAYPSIWPETSCISLVEAMSAGCVCVHPNYAALYETASNWTYMYGWIEDLNEHAMFFMQMLNNSIYMVKNMDPACLTKLKGQKSYVDLYYNWDLRAKEWEALLNSIRDEPRELVEEFDKFSYQVGI